MQTASGASLSGAEPQKSQETREPQEDQSSQTAPLRRRVGVLALVGAVVYALDVVTKIVAVATLSDRPPVELAGGLLTLRLTRNPGAAFGLGVDMTIVFTIAAVGVIGVIAWVARRLTSLPWALSLGMLLGGALGNLTDRLVRAPDPLHGHVVDFLELPHWPVFNVADTAIVGSAALMVLLSVRGTRLDATSHPPT